MRPIGLWLVTNLIAAVALWYITQLPEFDAGLAASTEVQLSAPQDQDGY